MQRFSAVAVASHVGQTRRRNEDCVVSEPGIVVLADGMGGHADGDIASRTAVEVVLDHAEELLEAAAEKAAIRTRFEAVFDEATAAVAGIGEGTAGTTLVVAVCAPDGCTVYLAHVGDSRAYLLRNEELLLPLTVDHNVEQKLLARGEAPAVAAAHPCAEQLVQAVGMGFVSPDIAEVRLTPADTLLLCSDGLYDMVSDTDIARLLVSQSTVAANALVELANENGGRDNVSVAVIRGGDEETGSAPLVDHLQELFLFAGLDRAQLSNVAPWLSVRTFDTGELLTREDEEEEECLILTRGTAEVLRGGLKLSEVAAGASVGELALIGPWRRSATVRALEPVTAYVLTRRDFEALARTRPHIGLEVTTALALHTAKRMDRVNQKLSLVHRALVE